MRWIAIILLAVTLTGCQPKQIITKTTTEPAVIIAPTITMEATAYCYTGSRTSTGTWPKEGRTVAVDPKIIPYGTKLEINGVSGYIAEDCGGAIKGNKIDIYFVDYDRCIVFGRRAVEVKIIE